MIEALPTLSLYMSLMGINKKLYFGSQKRVNKMKMELVVCICVCVPDCFLLEKGHVEEWRSRTEF